MKVWIVTPSFNQVDWLKRAVASVADQAGGNLQVHHHVQDGASTDGTAEWLKVYAEQQKLLASKAYSFSYESQSDEGMYHAINQGWNKTPQEYDFIAYINCDEQYLPGGLESIAQVFSQNEDAEVVLAGNIVVDGEGQYRCHRRAVHPYLWSARLWTASSACSTFMRRSVFFDHHGGFDTTWSIVGDMVWYVNLLEKKLTIHISDAMTSVFFDDGNNLATTPRGIKELQVYRKQCLGWTAWFTGFARQLNTFRRILADMHLDKPQSYSVYRSGKQREVIEISQPTNLWKR